VSLFGIKSIDDIKDRIFLELYPIFQNKGVKATSAILKAVLKSIDISQITGNGFLASGIDHFEEMGKSLGKDKLDYVDLQKLLICFDDLERVDPSLLTSNQILGYINSLVEDNNIKVIVVTNENKISDAKYKEIKEKTIGNTVHFHQDFKIVFDEIIRSISYSTPQFIGLLKSHEPLIYEILTKEDKTSVNYRTFKYFVTYFFDICHFVQRGFKIRDLDNMKDDVLKTLLKFSLMICIEYKKGIVDYQNRHGLEKAVDYVVKKIYKLKQPEPQSVGEKLIDSYFPDETYEYFESIYDYLTGGDRLDKAKLLRELCHNYRIEDQNIPEHYKTYTSLATSNIRKLSDREYLKETRKLLNFALEGKYLITEYITIFYYIMRFGNVLNQKPEALVTKFIKRIKSKSVEHVYHPLIDQYFRGSSESEFDLYYGSIFAAVKEVNEKARVITLNALAVNLEEELAFRFYELYNRVVSETDQQNKISFSNIQPEKFLQIFLKSDNLKKSEITLLIRIIYDSNKHIIEPADIVFFGKLKEVIESYLYKHKVSNISGEMLSTFQQEIIRKHQEYDLYKNLSQ